MPIPQHKTYDPSFVIATLAGIRLGGFTNSTAIKVMRNAELFTLIVGLYGDTVRVKNLDKTGIVSLSIMQSSTTNDRLAALHLQDERTNTGVGTFQLTELNSTMIVEAPIAWIQKMGDIQRGSELYAVEWAIVCPELFSFPGSNIL